MPRYMHMTSYNFFSQKSGKGFIALISSIIISLVLLSLITTANLSGFHSRFDVLSTEYQEVAIGIARSCADVALLKIVEDYNYAGGESITIGTDAQGRDLHCTIEPITGCTLNMAGPDEVSKTCDIKTKGEYGGSYSNAGTSATVQNPGNSTCVIDPLVDGPVCGSQNQNIIVNNTNLGS